MSAIREILQKPAVTAMFILVVCTCVMHSTSKDFMSDMREDRNDMVASLRQAQTPEPEVMAISKGFDRIASDVRIMGTSFFGFTTVVLVVAFAAKRNEPPRCGTQQPQEASRESKV